jgi:hypothetical protein
MGVLLNIRGRHPLHSHASSSTAYVSLIHRAFGKVDQSAPSVNDAWETGFRGGNSPYVLLFYFQYIREAFHAWYDDFPLYNVKYTSPSQQVVKENV